MAQLTRMAKIRNVHLATHLSIIWALLDPLATYYNLPILTSLDEYIGSHILFPRPNHAPPLCVKIGVFFSASLARLCLFSLLPSW